MPEPTVTIKFTESEVILINEMIGHHVADWQEKEQLNPAKYALQTALLNIEDMINEKKQEAINDQRISEESIEERIQDETSKRICVSCED